MRSPCALLLLLISAVIAEDPTLDGPIVRVEPGADAVVVRSAAEQGNFLFRAPPKFAQISAPRAGFAVELVQGEGAAAPRLAVRYGAVAENEARQAVARLAKSRAAAYATDIGGTATFSGEADRGILLQTGKTRVRAVLLVRDGDRLYELFAEYPAGDKALAAALSTTLDGFTLLRPLGNTLRSIATPAELKAAPLEHDYYKLRILKPEGFVAENVDPDKHKGIWTHLRRESNEGDICSIRIFVHLTRTLKQNTADRAQAALDKFTGRVNSPRAPRKPKRLRFAGSKEAYRLVMAGRLPQSGLVINEEQRLIDHENGRSYVVQLTMYGGAPRTFRKELKAFWKSFKVRGKK